MIAEFSESESPEEGLQIQLPSGATAFVSSSHQVALVAELIKALV